MALDSQFVFLAPAVLKNLFYYNNSTTKKLFSHQVDFPKGLQVLGILFLKKVYQDNVYLMIRKYFHTEILNFKQSDIL